MPKRDIWSSSGFKCLAVKRKPQKNSVEAIKTCGQYWVEAVRDHAIDRDGRLVFLLKWEGYAEEDNSWEVDQHVSDCADARQLFYSQTVNGRHPPKYSWEEFHKLVDYLRLVVNKAYTDLAVVYRLSDKKYTIPQIRGNSKLFVEIKSDIEAKVSALLEHKVSEKRTNKERLELNRLVTNVSKELAIEETFGSITQLFEFMDKRKELEPKLRKLEKDWNKVIASKGNEKEIRITNDVDVEVPALERYLCDCIYDKNVFERQKRIDEKCVLHSCKCEDCYAERNDCCTAVIGYPMAYNRKGVLSDSQSKSTIIFECNYKCKCGIDCPNRVIQRGRQYRLEVFRTEDQSGRGWGVRALEAIPRGAFITKYSGEVLSLVEANKRPTTYLFDLSASLDTTDDEYTYVIDATKYGNIGRFVNHSCEPNSRVLFSWSDSYDKLLPTIALFALRPIRANEEIVYDYGMQLIDIYDPSAPSIASENNGSTDSGIASSVADSTTEHRTARSRRSQATQPTPPLMVDKPEKVSFKRIECRCGSSRCHRHLYS